MLSELFCFSFLIPEKSVPQVALRWLLQKEVVSSVIIGVTSVSQLEDNVGAATEWKLSDEEVLSDIYLRHSFEI